MGPRIASQKSSQYVHFLLTRSSQSENIQVASKAEWVSIADVKNSFPSADKVGNLLIFNIGHNRYRLVVRVDFAKRVMFFKGLMTHKEYDRGEWKIWK